MPVIGLLGGGTGISVGTLGAEIVNKYTGQTGWYACGVKAGVKSAIGALTYFLSTKFSDGNASAAFFAEMIAYGAWGSIFLDVFAALYPGGLAGLADDFIGAGASAGIAARPITRELRRLEDAQEVSGTTRKEAWY